MTVGISGTGGGFRKFCRGETAIQDASRPILKQEMEECARTGVRYIKVPVAFDALTVVANPQNAFARCLTVAELKKVWEPAAQGKVTNWNQVREGFPDGRLTLYGAGSDSGTFDYFTEAVNGRAKASRGDYTASEDDNVLVQGVARPQRARLHPFRLRRRPDALGVFGFSFLENNRGRIEGVPIDGVDDTRETIASGRYPLSRPLFVYGKRPNLDLVPGLREMVEEYVSDRAVGPEGYLVKRGLVPLAPDRLREVREKVRNSAVMTGRLDR